MTDATQLRPGDPEYIAGYRVLSRLGSGGQGVVFLAAASNGDLVAIKRLLPGPEDRQARAQFAKEVAAARLVAPFCTAQVVDAHLDGESPYVVSEFISGPSLQQHVQRNGPILGTSLQRMAIGTATALAAIHQAGVVHRDFKPANVMLSPEGPRVIDFGVARDLSTETTVTSRLFGTPAYMSPEQLRADVVGPATDMFAWASVIAFAATGRAPFDAPHVMAVVLRIGSGEPDLTGVPEDLIGVLRQCLEKDPARRPTAQQTLALLLGRPPAQRDQTDPAIVLAEATGLVRPSDSAPVGLVATPIVMPAPAPVAAGSAPAAYSPFAHQVLDRTSTEHVPFEGSSSVTSVTSPPSVTSAMPMPSAASMSPETSTPSAASAASAQPVWGSPPRNLAGSPEAGEPAKPVWGSAPPRQDRPRRRAFLSTAVVLALLTGGVLAYQSAQSDVGLDPDTSPTTPATAQVEKPAQSRPHPSLPATRPGAEAGNDVAEVIAGALERAKQAGESGIGLSQTIPAALAGTWKGQMYVAGGDGLVTVRLILNAGASAGRVKFPQFGCAGTVEVTSAISGLLTLDSEITQNPKKHCTKHSKIVLLTSDGKMQFNIVGVDNANFTGSGFLHK